MEKLGGQVPEKAEQTASSESANRWDQVKDVKFAGQGWAKMTGYYKRNLDQIGDLIEGDNPEEVAEQTAFYQEHPEKVHELVREYLSRRAEQASDKQESSPQYNIPQNDTPQANAPEPPRWSLDELRSHDTKPDQASKEEKTEEPKIVSDTIESDTAGEQQEPQESLEDFMERMFKEANVSSEKKDEEPTDVQPEPEDAEQPEMKDEEDVEDVEEESEFGKYGETTFKVNAKEGVEQINPEKYLVFNLTDDEQMAIPRENLVKVYKEMVDNATDAKKYYQSTRLATQIAHEYQDNPEIMTQMKEVEDTTTYKVNRANAELATARKILAKRSDDLVRSQTELDKVSHGGPLKRLMNRMARKTAKSRVEWTQRDIDNAKKDIERLEEQLTNLRNTPTKEEEHEMPEQYQTNSKTGTGGNLAGQFVGDERDNEWRKAA